MSTQLVRLATAVLTSEKGRKTVGWVLTAILSPVILLVAFLCCVGSGTAEHNGAVVSAAFYGTELSESVPTEYRAQLTQMRGSFSHLDAAMAEVNQKAEGNSLDPIQVKAVFFALCFGADALSQADAEAFVACFYETETRVREETGETYAGFTRIHHIWTEGIPDVPKLFMGSPIQDRDMARGTLMALFLSTTVFPAETIQIPVYAETCVLLDDLMAGGWYA